MVLSSTEQTVLVKEKNSDFRSETVVEDGEDESEISPTKCIEKCTPVNVYESQYLEWNK